MKRREKEVRIKDRDRAAPVEGGPTYFEIGRNGTVEQLREANGIAINYKDYDNEHAGMKGQRNLQRGAIEAYLERGYRENIQAILLNPDEFKVRFNYHDIEQVDPIAILFQLIKGVDETTADRITQAVSLFPEQNRKWYLNDLLFRSVSDKYQGEDLVAALLKAGAKAEAEVDGFKGLILAEAVRNSRPMSVAERLYGGEEKRFEEALFYMQAHKWDAADVKCLKDYWHEITGKPVMIEVEPELMLQIKQTMDDLTARVEALTKPSASAGVQNKPRVLRTSP